MLNFEQYLKYSGRSSSTIRNYLLDIRLAVKHKIIDGELTFFNFQALSELDVSVNTKKRMLAGIRKFARYMVNVGRIEQIPQTVTTAELPKAKVYLPKVTSAKTAREMINATDSNEMKLAVLILGTTGCRIASLVSLSVNDFTNEGIQFHTAKGDNPYMGIISDEIKELLPKVASDGYVFCKRGGGVLSPDAFRMRMFRHFGDTYKNPHSFRHGVATDLTNNGVDIHTVSAVLNHKNIQTTTNYIHTTASHLRQKLEGKHSLLSDSIK